MKTIVEKGLKIATAESLTGGGLAAAIIANPGASAYFDEGLITYSNESKVHRLGVRESTLAAHGAVSPECASEMAAGIAQKARADIGIATTGIAGPDGGSTAKPVGLVYIAIHYKNATEVRKFNFAGSRTEIIAQTISAALEMLQSII